MKVFPEIHICRKLPNSMFFFILYGDEDSGQQRKDLILPLAQFF